MPVRQRIKKIEAELTIKEIVIRQIRECQRFGTMADHAHALATGGMRGETLCSRIEAAVNSKTVGKPVQVRQDRIRAAQRDGVFLARLATECNLAVARTERERDLEEALISVLAVHAAANHTTGEEGAASWVPGALVVRTAWTELEAAVRLIEREYFDGVAVMYPATACRLRSQIERLEGTLAVAGTVIARNGAGTSGGLVKASCTNPVALRAQQLVVIAKAQALQELGEFAEQARVLDEYFLATVKPGSS